MKLMINTKNFIETKATPEEYYELAAQAQTQVINLLAHVDRTAECQSDEIANFFHFSLALMRAVKDDVTLEQEQH